MESLFGILVIAFLIGSLLFAGMKKIAPTFYLELFFVLVMVIVNIVTGIIAFFVGAMATQTGGNVGFLMMFLAIEGIPFLLLILSFILLMRKL